MFHGFDDLKGLPCGVVLQTYGGDWRLQATARTFAVYAGL